MQRHGLPTAPHHDLDFGRKKGEGRERWNREVTGRQDPEDRGNLPRDPQGPSAGGEALQEAAPRSPVPRTKRMPRPQVAIPKRAPQSILQVFNITDSSDDDLSVPSTPPPPSPPPCAFAPVSQSFDVHINEHACEEAAQKEYAENTKAITGQELEFPTTHRVAAGARTNGFYTETCQSSSGREWQIFAIPGGGYWWGAESEHFTIASIDSPKCDLGMWKQYQSEDGRRYWCHIQTEEFFFTNFGPELHN